MRYLLRRKLLVIFPLAVCLFSKGQIIQAPGPRLLRFEEDYHYVTDSMKENSLWLKTKRINVNRTGTIYTNYGLDTRAAVEYLEGYPGSGISDGYFITRLMVYADVHIKNRWRLFIQPARAMISGRDLPLRPVDKDQLFLLNAFAEYRIGKKQEGYIRAGRQELFFGMGRLIAPREGPNIRSTYDGFRIHVEGNKNLAIDVFAVYTVKNNPGVFDDTHLDNNQRLWGAYSNLRFKKMALDLYYIGTIIPDARYTISTGPATETRHSVGIRAFGTGNSSIKYDNEFTWQFGKFGGIDISAFLADMKLFADMMIKKAIIRPTLKLTYASGNKIQSGKTLSTYNALFPNLLYYQTAVGLFPSNIRNIQPGISCIARKFMTTLSLDFFWRSQTGDGLYSPFGIIELPPDNRKYLGNQWNIKADYFITTNLTGTFIMSKYSAGELIRNNPDRRGVDLLMTVMLYLKI